jgi:hypothetical protein
MKYRTFILILAATLGTGLLIESISGQALVTGGNAQQTRDKCGFVKAMIFIQGNFSSTIVSCFNSYLSGDAATTPPCGFSVRESFGFGSNHAEYREVNFGFRVDDRFVNTFTPNGRVIDARYGYGVVTETTNPNVLSITTDERSDCTIFVY